MLVELAFGRCRRLIVNMPPRHGKSELVSAWFPAWYLDLFPDRRIILTSYEADFAASWGRRVRNILQEHEGALDVHLAGDSTAANRWDTTAGGGMITAGVRGPITGRGGHVLVVDDPVKNAEEAHSQTIRERIWAWWTSTAYSRLEPDGAAIVIQTRWHEDDLTGRLIEQAKGPEGEDWTIIKLPAIAEDDDVLGRAPGEPLWPARFSLERLLEIKGVVGSYDWNALWQQRPAPAEGGIIKRAWLKYYRDLPELDLWCQSWDCSFKDTASSDHVAGHLWAGTGARRFLLDRVNDRMGLPATIAAIRAMTAKWPEASAKFIEDKANGPAVIQVLGEEIEGLIAVDPEGSKEARAYAVSPQWEAGNCYLPDPELAPWVMDLVEEIVGFPNARFDDDVDAMTQALLRMRSMGPAYQTAGLPNVDRASFGRRRR